MPESIMLGAEFACYDCEAVSTVNSKNDLIEKLKCESCRTGGVPMSEVLKVIEGLKDES